MRIKFEKGKQREFIEEVLKLTGCPSLKELINRGVDAKYSSLKNYYCERRLLPEWLFDRLLILSGLKRNEFVFELVDSYWGQVKGGMKSKKNGPARN